MPDFTVRSFEIKALSAKVRISGIVVCFELDVLVSVYFVHMCEF